MRELKPWEERFVKEYRELSERQRKLHYMLLDWTTCNLQFTPKCPLEILYKQDLIMQDYLGILQQRAEIEDIPFELLIESDKEEEEEPRFCYECAHSVITIHDCGAADRGYQLCTKGCPKLDPAYCGHFIARELR